MKVWATILREIEAGRRAGLITVMSTRGSAPREAGARIVLTQAGFHGTIGGGALEWRALAEAQADLERNRRDYRFIDLALGPDTGQCCGGRVLLGFETFSAEDLSEMRGLAAAEAEGLMATSARLVDGRWRRAIVPVLQTASACFQTLDGTLHELFGDDPRRLVLFGAGHVGRALVLALAPLPFAVTWVDERAEAFPGAAPRNAHVVVSMSPLDEIVTAPSGAFVLAMTHSHALDLEIVDAALRADRFAYVGVIGSATKRARFLSQLRQMGHGEAVLGRLVCPIGATGPKSRLPAVIGAAVTVELLVADEMARAAVAPHTIEPSATPPVVLPRRLGA